MIECPQAVGRKIVVQIYKYTRPDSVAVNKCVLRRATIFITFKKYIS
jgi:hypothetical protein